ncbi:Zinc finger protein [Plecturocebus cupreus]
MLHGSLFLSSDTLSPRSSVRVKTHLFPSLVLIFTKKHHSTNQIELHISLVSKSDEFVFINSRPSGADTLPSVNQTCIKLQGSESVPEPVFWRVNNNRGRKRPRLYFSFKKSDSNSELNSFHYASFILHLYLLSSKPRILIIIIFFCKWSFTLVECSGAVSAHCNLHLLDSSESSALVSRVAGITGMCHHAWLIFVLLLVEMGFHHVGQAGLKFLTLGDPPTSASQSAGITAAATKLLPPKRKVVSVGGRSRTEALLQRLPFLLVPLPRSLRASVVVSNGAAFLLL